MFRTGFDLDPGVLVLANPPPSVSYVTAVLTRAASTASNDALYRGVPAWLTVGAVGGVGLGRSCFSLETLELVFRNPLEQCREPIVTLTMPIGIHRTGPVLAWRCRDDR